MPSLKDKVPFRYGRCCGVDDIFQMEETTKVWGQAFGKDRKQEILLGLNLQRKLKIEMWVPFPKIPHI